MYNDSGAEFISISLKNIFAKSATFSDFSGVLWYEAFGAAAHPAETAGSSAFNRTTHATAEPHNRTKIITAHHGVYIKK